MSLKSTEKLSVQ